MVVECFPKCSSRCRYRYRDSYSCRYRYICGCGLHNKYAREMWGKKELGHYNDSQLHSLHVGHAHRLAWTTSDSSNELDYSLGHRHTCMAIFWHVKLICFTFMNIQFQFAVHNLRCRYTPSWFTHSSFCLYPSTI